MIAGQLSRINKPNAFTSQSTNYHIIDTGVKGGIYRKNIFKGVQSSVVFYLPWREKVRESALFSYALLLAILRWRHTEVALCELAEEGEIWKAEQLRNLFYGEVGAT